MKKKLISILKMAVRALRAIIYALSGGHLCGCKNDSAEKDGAEGK